MNEALAGGAVALVRPPPRQRARDSTVLARVTSGMKVWREEVFGPVLTVAPYRSWAEAIRLANATRYGLQAGIFTHDARRIEQAFRELQVGGGRQ